MYGRLMPTKLGYIDGQLQTIYGIHTDPMGYGGFFGKPPFIDGFFTWVQLDGKIQCRTAELLQLGR